MPRHKSRLIRLAPIVTLIALALVLPAGASAACPGAGQPSSQLGPDQAQDAIRCLINGVRENRGKKKLRQRDTLEAAAQYHSTDMAVAGYFSHDAPDGSSSFDRAISFGYMKGSGGVGEVIAGGDASFTPAAALGDWMSSGGHRSVVLDRSWRHIGVGMAYVSGEVLYTVDFGHH